MELPAHWRDWNLGLEVPDDASAADWLHAALRPWAQDGTIVANFVPASHEAFARVLHPAGDGTGREVRWADLAAARGRVVGPDTSLSEATGIIHMNGRSVVENRTPSDGSLPAAQTAALGEVLAAFTATPDDCVFCFWRGFGIWGAGNQSISDPGLSRAENDSLNRRLLARWMREKRELAALPVVYLPARDHYVFTGPLGRTQRPFTFGEEWKWEQSPSIWWPHDRAWFVATEIDGYSTYVGGSAACVDAIVACPGIETIPVTAETPMDPGPFA